MAESLERFPLEDLIGEPPVREREFRVRLAGHNWETYRRKAVLIPWVHNTELPLWVYLMVAARLAGIAAVLSFGEACSPTVLIQNQRVRDDINES